MVGLISALSKSGPSTTIRSSSPVLALSISATAAGPCAVVYFSDTRSWKKSGRNSMKAMKSSSTVSHIRFLAMKYPCVAAANNSIAVREMKKTTIAFVNPQGQPVADLPVRMVPAGDVIPLEGGERSRQAALELVTDRHGKIEYEPLAWTHARLEVHDGLVDVKDPLIPDTLKKARIEIQSVVVVRLVGIAR